MKKIFYFYIIELIFSYGIAAQEIYPEKTKHNFNPLIPDYIADPSLVFFNNTYYLYATTDIDSGLFKMGIPVVWKSENFVDWSFSGTIIPGIDWDKPYYFTNNKGEQKKGYFRYWAPGKPIYRNNRYYLFPTIVKPDESLGTYVMTSDKPEGPFIFSNGTGLYFNDTINNKNETQPLINDIDGEPFVDTDGKPYIFWRRRNGSALNDSLTQLIGNVVRIPTKFSGYSEGPVMFKRNNIYYYIYTLSGHANYCNGYMISRESPLGPFEAPKGNNVFIHSDIVNNVWGPGHGNVFRIPETDKYIFLYLEYGEGGTTRQVYANYMNFNEDGTIIPVKVDPKGIGYLTNSNIKENLALKAKIIASSFKDDKTVTAKIIPDPNKLTTLKVNTRDGEEVKRIFSYDPENAADGSNGTRWWAKNDDKNPWILLDLGEIKKISSCEIAFIFPTFGHTWKLEKSINGRKWEICSETKEKAIISPHIATEIGKTRYLKLYITEGIPGIWEIKVYE